MGTRHSAPVYICDRCFVERQQTAWPTNWGTYALPGFAKGPLIAGTFLPKLDVDLCDKCIQSLTAWVTTGKTVG